MCSPWWFLCWTCDCPVGSVSEELEVRENATRACKITKYVFLTACGRLQCSIYAYKFTYNLYDFWVWVSMLWVMKTCDSIYPHCWASLLPALTSNQMLKMLILYIFSQTWWHCPVVSVCFWETRQGELQVGGQWVCNTLGPYQNKVLSFPYLHHPWISSVLSSQLNRNNQKVI